MCTSSHLRLSTAQPQAAETQFCSYIQTVNRPSFSSSQALSSATCYNLNPPAIAIAIEPLST